MAVLPILSPITQHTQSCGVGLVVGDDRTTLTICAKILARIKAEAGHVTEGAGAATVIFSAVRLGGVLNQNNAATPSDLRDGLHVRALPIEMYWDNRLRSRRHCRFDQCRVHGG